VLAPARVGYTQKVKESVGSVEKGSCSFGVGQDDQELKNKE